MQVAAVVVMVLSAAELLMVVQVELVVVEILH
jgi:hypothetical protein